MRLRKNYIHNYKFMAKNEQRGSSFGFTLVEVIVAVGILSVLASFGCLASMDFYRSYAFNAERDTIVAILQKARSQSLANVNNSVHGAHFGLGQYVIFQGSVYDSGSAFNQSIPAGVGVTASGLTNVVFAQLSGDAGSGGNLRLSDGKRLAEININSEGRIDW
jgi:prepilin-type N-terminal cleavage/methylation domain-containing protein